MNIWPSNSIHKRPLNNTEARLRNRPGLKSESGCGGSITFRYSDGFEITIKTNGRA